MMRDSAHIDEVLATVREAWMLQPHRSLGNIINDSVWYTAVGGFHVYDVPDFGLEHGLRVMMWANTEAYEMEEQPRVKEHLALRACS